MTAPFEGIRVVELTQGLAGPYCSMQLGDLGAGVIKVEPLQGDEARGHGPPFIKGESALFLGLNRNKRSIAVDTGHELGKEIVSRLVRQSDVCLEDFRPPTTGRQPFGYEAADAVNPAIIYCSVSPFGERGPWADRAGSELIAQGMAGYTRYVGTLGEPPLRVGVDHASISAGVFAFQGIAAALFWRKRTGVGQKVEVSLLGALVSKKTALIGAQSGPDRWEGYMVTAPFDGPDHGYQTKDSAVVLSLGLRDPDRLRGWVRFCQEVGVGDLTGDPWWAENGPSTIGISKAAKELKPVYEKALSNWTSSELEALVERLGGQCMPFNSYETLLAHPQVAVMEMVVDIEHPVAGTIKVTGLPWKFCDTPGHFRYPPPTLGQHTEEILQWLGYTMDEIQGLRDLKVVK